MKKTVSINLNSFMFVIDEDAYNVLHVYLNKLEEHFSNIEEGGEIVKDIEARIAEIFNTKRSESKQVINLSDVEEVIGILGNVEDITGDEPDEKTTEKESKKTKKLYRDPEYKYLGGVCSGLAEYTGISVSIWRIIFLILLFAGQVGVIAYLILWIAVPEAKTTAQKIEMKGGKITLSSIEKTVKQEFEDVKKNFKKMKTSNLSETLNNLWNSFGSIFKVFCRVFGKILGVSFLIAGAAIIAITTIAFISVGKDNIVFTSDFINMVWLPGLLKYVTNTGTAWFISICLLFVFIIPVIAIINWGLILLFNVKTNKYLSLSTFAVWIFAIILTVVAFINVGASFRATETITKTETLAVDSLNTYYFSLSPEFKDICLPDGKHCESGKGMHFCIDSHYLLFDNNKLKSFVEIEFIATNDSVAGMELKYNANGPNKNEAKENIKSISYTYSVDTNTVYFEPYINIKTNKWKAQEVKILIKIPYGANLIIDKNLSDFINIEDITGKFEDSEMTGRELLSTKQGFVVKDIND